jgi:hypothetical protein
MKTFLLIFFLAFLSKLNAQQVINVNIQPPCIITSIEKPLSKEVKISYSNSDKVIHLEFETFTDAIITVNSILGQEVYYQKESNLFKKDISLLNYNEGIYLIAIYNYNNKEFHYCPTKI